MEGSCSTRLCGGAERDVWSSIGRRDHGAERQRERMCTCREFPSTRLQHVRAFFLIHETFSYTGPKRQPIVIEADEGEGGGDLSDDDFQTGPRSSISSSAKTPRSSNRVSATKSATSLPSAQAAKEPSPDGALHGGERGDELCVCHGNFSSCCNLTPMVRCMVAWK